MSKAKICIIDYGLGNLFNVQRAFKFLGTNAVVSSSPKEVYKYDKIVLPGVGAFGEGIKNLRKSGLLEVLVESKDKGKSILGICLGMQLLLSESEENGLNNGLAFIPGKVVRFPPSSINGRNYKVPQISWNSITYSESQTNKKWKNSILKDLPDQVYMYFVHSFYARVEKEKDSIALTNYGNTTYTSVVQFENVVGCQFHPERSGKFGLKILQNFISD